MQQSAFDPVRFPLDPELVGEFLAEEATGARRATAQLREQIRELVRQHVDQAPGFLVLTGLAGLTEEDARRFTVAASRLVGELLPQDASGALLRDVRDRGLRLGEGSSGRYSDSRDGGNLHTDGPHMPFPAPEYFTLVCVRQSTVGGDLVLASVSDVTADLEPEHIAQLCREFHFDRRQEAADPPTVVHPVLAEGARGTTVRYLREYIELGHARPTVADLTDAQRAALDALDARLNSPRVQQVGKLAPGEMIFINNLVLCHGRTAFVDDAGEHKRLMLRTWIRRTDHP